MTEKGWVLSMPADPTPSVSECVGLSVGLRRAKGVEGHASLEDRSQGAVVVERTIEALGIENLRHETNVRHGDGIAIAEATSEARASQVSLQTCQSLSDPMAVPAFGCCLVGSELRLDVLEHAHVVERVNIAADDLRHRSHVMASVHVCRHQRRLRVNLVQILDDGHR